MQKLNSSILINAPREKVWNTMLGDETYRIWTTEFNPGSYYEGSWEKGTKMLFLGPDPKDGVMGGMSSVIVENKPLEYISIEHKGFIKNGVEDFDSEEVKKWVPAFENYSFEDKDGGTLVSVELDVNDEYKAMFEEVWPKALLALKNLCENK